MNKLLVLLAAVRVFAAEPDAVSYQVRLLDPLGSRSDAGGAFRARVVGPLQRHATAPLPEGTLIRGSILRARAVGLGVRRERALLDLQFETCTLPSGITVDCEVRLTAVDNARESVAKPNQIRGIVAASHPHSWLNGVWIRPAPALFGKSTVGLTGAGGMLHANLLPNPVAGLALVVARIAFYRLPEPEIVLPAGTDLIVRIAHASSGLEPAMPSHDVGPALQEALTEELRNLPIEIRHEDSGQAADIPNFAFLGDGKQLRQAFAAAGWVEAEPLNAKSFARTYKAFAAMKTYPSAPVSPLRFQGQLPDAVFQKSFNSLAKRHHIRLWKLEWPAGEVWVGAATHDTGIAFNWKRISLTHKIDRRIDRERSFLLNDLIAAGCASSVAFVERPELAAEPAARGPRATDGALAAVTLQDCAAPVPAEPAISRKPRFPFRVTRRVLLETRQYVVRGNPYYYLHRTIQWTRTRPLGDAADD